MRKKMFFTHWGKQDGTNGKLEHRRYCKGLIRIASLVNFKKWNCVHNYVDIFYLMCCIDFSLINNPVYNMIFINLYL